MYVGYLHLILHRAHRQFIRVQLTKLLNVNANEDSSDTLQLYLHSPDTDTSSMLSGGPALNLAESIAELRDAYNAIATVSRITFLICVVRKFVSQ